MLVWTGEQILDKPTNHELIQALLFADEILICGELAPIKINFEDENGMPKS